VIRCTIAAFGFRMMAIDILGSEALGLTATTGPVELGFQQPNTKVNQLVS